MKRLVPLAVVVIALAVVAAGCGSKKSSSGTTTTAATTTTAGGGTFKVGLSTDIGGLNDRSFNHLAYVGLQRAARELGVQTRVVQSNSPADYIPNLIALARQGYNLIIGVGFTEIDAVKAVAKQFPKSHFAIVDVSNADEGGLKNVEGLLFKEQEAGYLAGYAAGLAAKDRGGNTVSSVGGQKQPPVDRYIAGFQAGAKAGHFKGGQDAVYGLSVAGVGIGKFSAKAPKGVAAKVAEVKQQIAAGKIKNIPTIVK